MLSPFSIFYASTCLLFAQYKRDISHFASFSWCIFYLLRELRSRSSVAPCVPLLGPVLPRLWPGASLDRFFLPLFLAFLLALRLFPFSSSCSPACSARSKVQGFKDPGFQGAMGSRVQGSKQSKGSRVPSSEDPKSLRSEGPREELKDPSPGVQGVRVQGPKVRRSKGPKGPGVQGCKGSRVQGLGVQGCKGPRVQAFKGARDPRKGPKVRGLKGPRIQGSQGSKVQRSEG